MFWPQSRPVVNETEKTEIFNRLREIDRALNGFQAHVESCKAINDAAAAERADIARRAINFRRELRGYLVTIVVGAMTLYAGGKLHWF